ncbi:tyrosine-type recombinase/integrase [Palleronia sp. LCG004]|uniref:tyrosine-type recombinase/integrase n=1 Tax=Palleronia sp. LCG004 TaxID=3079304 RepID=UPI0029437047|nr:tyrosine-type recombinase/integrase [Palleronia sp. LCG004]WOI56592.1 tyrosine-type recombinase/integrase [Palleronia sp. LCG004]
MNTETAVKHLHAFLEDPAEAACLEDVTPHLARRFRDVYLPAAKSPRAPNGLSSGTVNKNVTLLKAIWVWAIDRNLTAQRYRDPWVFTQLTPRARSDEAPRREDFTAQEVSAILSAAPRGTREGDLLRLALVTGCRVDELAMVKTQDLEDDAEGINLAEGKSRNARRYVPIPEGAWPIMSRRLVEHGESGPLFPDWPIRPSVGKVYAISQWFTRFRRQVLGGETDKRLSLHSTRHTWRTVARQARVPEGDIHDIGGWAGPRTSSTVYDHGLLKEQLAQTQEAVWSQLEAQGFLRAF